MCLTTRLSAYAKITGALNHTRFPRTRLHGLRHRLTLHPLPHVHYWSSHLIFVQNADRFVAPPPRTNMWTPRATHPLPSSFVHLFPLSLISYLPYSPPLSPPLFRLHLSEQLSLLSPSVVVIISFSLWRSSPSLALALFSAGTRHCTLHICS